MTANVNSGSTYLITNVKAGTAMDSSAGDNTTGKFILPYTAQSCSNIELVLGWPVNGDNGSANQHVCATLFVISFSPAHDRLWKWAMSWTGSAWTFQNVWTGKFLTAVGTNDGANITATDTPFGWDIWRDENDPNTFRIFVPNTHENLDLWGNGLATPGNPITLWWTWNGLHQTWNFTEGTGFM
ncbi:hypothetical protein CVT26_003578 [Gymnopilus dilepis]|uniref:Ricin B lectin domain-containing protein n=1 Tax=Gymnopilus dilepis TaxID=231916 RepID=A0A409VS69_9AGAR|nr:hypothetical protein CVT26_003578 [Gymnopilus dilepis]